MASRRFFSVCLGLALLGTVGCKKSDTAAASAPAAAPTTPVASSNQLAGSWFREDDGDIVGIEFAKDGKALVTMGDPGSAAVSPTVTFEYATLDNGRVRMTGPGFTTVFKCNVDGSHMTFEPETPGEVKSSKFVRLASDQTVAEANKAAAKERAAKLQAMLAAGRALLAKPNLTLASADPKMRLDRFALELKDNGGGNFTGTGYWEGNTVVARQAQAFVQPNRNHGQPPVVTVSLGQVVGPPGQKPMNPETFTLPLRGEGDALEATDGARALRSDATAFAAITERYKKEADEREALINKFADQYGSFCRLAGELHFPNDPKPRVMTIGLLRVAGKPNFMMADMTRDANPLPTAFATPVGIVLIEGKPLLNCGPALGVLQPSEDGKTLRGSVQAANATFTVAEQMTLDQVKKRRADVADFLDNQLKSGLCLSGPYVESDAANAPVRPICLDLTTDGQRNLGGTYTLPYAEAKCAIAGKAVDTLLGAKLQVDAGKVTEDKQTLLRGRGHTLLLDVVWTDAGPVIRGINKNGYQNNSVSLDVATPQRLKAQRDRLQALLKPGGTFAALTENSTMPDRPATVDLKLDGDGPNVTGRSTYPDKRVKEVVCPLGGELKEANGLLLLDLVQKVDNPQTARQPYGPLRLWVIPDDKGITLAGYMDSQRMNPRHPMGMAFRCTDK